MIKTLVTYIVDDNLRLQLQQLVNKQNISEETLLKLISDQLDRNNPGLYQQILDKIKESVVVFAFDGTILYWNQHAQTSYGYSPEEVIGKNALDVGFIDPDMRAFAHHRLEQLRQVQADIGNALIRHKNGQRLEVTFQNHLLCDTDGTPIGVVNISWDVTESHQNEQRKLQLSIEREKMRVLRDFLANASHDLRTPLTTMGTSLYLLRRGITAPAHLSRIESIERNLAQLTQLLSHLFEMTELDIKTNYKFTHFDLNDVLPQIVTEQQGPLAEKGHTIQWALSPRAIWLQADQEYINQALTKIVTNAIQHTPSGGMIRIETAVADDRATIVIQDNGVGIAPKHLPHIFERFYRADASRQMTDGNNGLGLAIAQKIIVAHGGTIIASSTPGEGSRFRVALPLSRSD